jgi:hypothetical protein
MATSYAYMLLSLLAVLKSAPVFDKPIVPR